MRNVIVTGASRGLGLAIARGLAQAGYSVLGIARRASPEFDAIAAELLCAGTGKLQLRAFDLADTAGLSKLVNELRTQFGAIYALVNNAGIGTGGVLGVMRDGQIEQLLRLNVLSPITLTKYVVRTMMAIGEGRIVNISSIIASTGYSGLSVYGASKAALIGFTRSLAREVGPLGITVNAVAPGFIDTEMTSDLDDDDRQRIVRRSALRRQATPADVAAAVEYLLGAGAQNITGSVLTVDAGSTA